MTTSSKSPFFSFSRTRVIVVLVYVTLAVLLAYSQEFLDKAFCPPGKSLSLFLFSDVITEEVLKRFQAETGIKLNVKYCDTDSEIWTQLYASGGIGYDIISPTDHMVQRMKNDGLLQLITPSKIDNYAGIDPFFQSNAEDYKDFSIPCSWSYIGIGYRKNFFVKLGFDAIPNSWKYVFEPYLLTPKDSISKDPVHLRKLLRKYNISMVDEPLDILALANLYFNKTTTNFSQANIDRIIQKLVAQKRFVRAYTSSNIGYYLTRVSHCVLAISAHIKVASKVLDPKCSFVVPKEGSLMTVQHLAIPKYAKNVELAYKFISYVLEDQTQKLLFNESGFLPTNQSTLSSLYKKDFFVTLGVDNLSKFYRINKNLNFEKAYETMLIIKTRSK